MPSIADVYVTILPETSRVAAGIRSALRNIDMTSTGRRWGNEIKRGMGEVGVEVDADTKKARKEIDDLERQLGKPHKIKIEHDKSSFAQAATAARNLEQNFQSIAIAAAAVPNTIATVGTAATQLTGVLGLMPAAIGTAALAFGSLKIATMGFGDALKEIRDPAKFAEAIAQLAPNAQQAATAIQGLMPQITQLKMTVQDAFFAGFGDQIKQLGSTYLPMFQGVMSQMAGSAGTALRSVSQMLTTPQMAGDMQQMTGNMSSAFNLLSQALAPVVKAFLDIGVVGSGFLPALAAAATEAAQAFAMFIDKARSTGELQEWIQTGINAFKQLMDIAGNVGSIIGGIMKAAPEGGGLLGMLQQLTQTLADFVNSPAGQGAFSTFMTAMSATMSALMPVLGSFLTAIAPILGMLGQLAATVITSIAPAFTQWFTAMTPVVQQIVNSLQPVIAALAPVLQQVATVLLTSMLNGIQTLLPSVVGFAGAFGNWLQAILPLLPSLMQLALGAMPAFHAILSLVLPILTTVLNVMADIANRVVPVLSGAIDALSGVFSDRWQKISHVVTMAWTIMEPIFTKIIDRIGQVMDAIGRLMNNPLGRFLTGPASALSSLFPANSGSSAPASTSALPGLTPGSTVTKGTQGAVPKPGTNEYWIPPAKGDFSHGNLGYSTSTPPALAPASAFPAAPTPPVSSYTPPAPASGGGGGGGGGNTPSAVSPTGTDWDAVAEGESKGDWSINTGNGYYGGLQFDLATWNEFGGQDFATRPDLASREEQIQVAERVPVEQRPNRWPNTYSKGAVGRPPASSGTSSYTPNGYSSSSSAAATSSDPRTFAHETMMPYWESMGVKAEDHAADQHGEHQKGALDIMVPDIATGQQVLQQVLNDPNVYGAIFNSQSYGYGNGPGGKPYGGANPHTDHVHAWYKPGDPNNINPSGTGGAGGGMTPYGMADSYSSGYADDRSVREAQQKVEDTKQKIADEEAQLAKLRTKPGTSPEDIAKQERDVAKARREHKDALDDLTAAQNKYNKAAGEQGGEGGFSGQDFMAGIAEFFGFDGSLFKNPADFGLVKLLGGISKLKPAGDGSGNAASAMDGGGGGGLTGLLSSFAQPFGELGKVPAQNAPGQFMPTMPETANAGGVLGRAFAPAGAPGPGNQVDNSIHINNPTGPQQYREGFDAAQSAQYPRMRQPNRHNP